jgi:hypothetical protein
MSLRTAVLALFLLLPIAPAPAAASPAGVDTVAFLEQRVSLSVGGDAGLTVTVVLAADGPGEALLPFGLGPADSFTVAGGDVAFAPDADGVPAPLRLASRRRMLALGLGPAAAAGDTVVVRCRLPEFVDWDDAGGQFGAYDVAWTFLNDSDLSIGVYRLVLVVPQGYGVRRVTGTEPAYKPKSSPVPPYAVGREGGRGFASLAAAHLRPGGRARLGIQAERAGRGPVPLVAGVLVTLLYLWFFRDVPATRRAAAAAPPRANGGR